MKLLLMMNRIILILAISFYLNVFSQEHDSHFFNKFKFFSKIYVFDELEDNSTKYPVIDYDIIEKYLRTPFNKPYIFINNIQRNTFFAIGKIKVNHHHYGLLIQRQYSYRNETEKYLYLAIYANNHKLVNFSKIGDLSFINNLNNNIVVYPNGEIFEILYNKDDLLKYKIKKIEYYTEEEGVSVNFILQNNKIINNNKYDVDQRKCLNRKYVFDKKFMLKNLLLVPIRSVLNFKKSKSLYSIKGVKEKNFDTFFIDCFYFNKKKIVLVLNRYNYLTFNRVSDVTIIIFDENDELIDSKRISHIYIDDKNKVVSINESKVKINKDKLLILNKNNKQIGVYK